MIESRTVLKIEINERKYELTMSPQSPLGEAFDALCQMQGFVSQRIKEHTEAQKPQEICDGDKQ